MPQYTQHATTLRAVKAGEYHLCRRREHVEEPGGGVLVTMHGRSRTAIDPRIPTMPGRSTSSFYRAGRHRYHQTRSDVRCWASRMRCELHSTKTAYEADFLACG